MINRGSPRQADTVTTDGGSSDLAPSPPAIIPTIIVGIPPELAADLNQAEEFARAEKAMATRRAYKSDFEIFELWCANRGAGALPAAAETVGAFLAFEAVRRIKPSTIGRQAASSRYARKLAGHPVPTDDQRVRATLRGIRRAVGTAPSKKATATADRLIAMAAAGDGGITAMRDRALLLLGFGGAFRRSPRCGRHRRDQGWSARHHPTIEDGARASYVLKVL